MTITETMSTAAYLYLARIVAVLHIAFAIFALFGGFVTSRAPALLWPHLASAAWAFGTLAFDWGCPVTPLEKYLRGRAGTASYDGGFVQHYLTRTAYSGKRSQRLHALLALMLLAINLFAYRARLGLG